MIDKNLFAPDDIDRINTKYFEKIRNDDAVVADPSYWYYNYSQAAIESGYEEIKNYRSDYQYSLKKEKPAVVNALSSWDNADYGYDDMTICSSTTTGSLIILCYLKNLFGLNNLLIETPCYFGSLKQAQYLGFKVKMLPTYHPNYKIDLNSLKTDYPKVVWLTQPRFGLGTNYNKQDLEAILSVCNKKDYIVIDEATENQALTHLHQFNFKYDERIIKTRSIFKGIGINGPRLSLVIHGKNHRSNIQIILEQVQGAIDVHSLNFTTRLLLDQRKFFSLLRAANSQVVTTYKKLKCYAIGTNLKISELNNGAIGSIALTYGKSELGYVKRRERLIAYCAINNMPIILGSNMYFAKDQNYEHIRVTYFNELDNLKKSIEILSKFSI